MRSLETAATAGVAIVLTMAGIIAVESLRAGLPAIASGEMPLWRLQARGQASYQTRRSPMPFICRALPGLLLCSGFAWDSGTMVRSHVGCRQVQCLC